MYLEKPIIQIEGLPGCGKTSLIEWLEKTLNIRAFYEPVEENPYFIDQYKDPRAYAFKAQLDWALKRAEIHELATAEVLFGVNYDGAIIDRGLLGDMTFEALHRYYGNIDDRDHNMYLTYIKRLTNTPKAPSLVFYLDSSPEVSFRRMQKRNRAGEEGVKIEYLYDLNDHYHDNLIRYENGEFGWVSRPKLYRIPWNVDHQKPDKIISVIKKEYPIFEGAGNVAD